MLSEKQMERYAEVLLWGLQTARTRKYKKNDLILIRFSLPGIRLAEILEEKILKMGLIPISRFNPTPAMEKNFLKLSNNSQLTFRAPGDKELYEHLNGSIFLHAPESITHLSNIDPQKIGQFAMARKYLRDINDNREINGDFGWTLCMLPTKALAKHAGLSLESYTNQIVKACFLNRVEPLKHWQTVFTNAISVKKWLNSLKVNYYHIESANIDLIITLGAQRKWIGISGHNIPSFEIFTSPDWRGTKGIYYADQPSFRTGNYVEKIRLEFKNGYAEKISAATGEDFVKKQLTMDKGANRVGEFSLTDKRFSRINQFMANTLFDENYGGKFGNCHIALGACYLDTYTGNAAGLTKTSKDKLGFNNSALHWDLVNTEKKTVTAHLNDGKKKIIYENGQFLY